MDMHEKIGLTVLVALLVVGFAVTANINPKARIDVEEACEQLNTFMHEGKRYYCAPWVEYTKPAAPAPAAEELTRA